MKHSGGKALITGGAGFVGSHLAEALLGRGYHVDVIDDLSTGRPENVQHMLDRPGFQMVVDTITNEPVMERLVGQCQVVFHLAAAVGVELIVRDPVRVMETNVLGTHIVLKVASRHGRKVLLASSSEVYGKGNRVPFKEDDDQVLGPTSKARWSYAASKTVEEFLGLAYHRQQGLGVVIFRLFNTVGPRQTGRYGMVVPRFVQQALAGSPLTVYGDGQQTRCFLNVRDAVEAIIGLAECPQAEGQVFNVGSTQEITILDLAKRVLTLVAEMGGDSGGKADEGSLVFVPYEKAYQQGFEDLRRRVPDIGKIGRLLGWEPRVSLDETLRQVIDYCRNSGGRL